MTRQDVMNEFAVVDGIIQDLGKFEGEMLYVPYFWESFLGGGADDDDGEYITFKVTHYDLQEFPELSNQVKVVLRQRDDGFVCEC